MSIAVIVPVLGRPHNAAKVAHSLERSGATERGATLYFICSAGDTRQIAACLDTGCITLVRIGSPRGEWSAKINWALRQTTEDWLLLGADDLFFHDGWDSEALRVAAETGAGVVGTNDLGNPYVKRGDLATHALVARWYAEQHGTIDQPGQILHEGYYHNWVDAELTETAKARGLFAFAKHSVVEHNHPHWGKAEMDDTYRKALDQRHFEADRRLLQRRRRLWLGELRRRNRLAGRGARTR